MKNIELNPQQLKNSLKQLAIKMQRYAVFIFIIGVLGLYGFLVYQIGQLSQAEPKADDTTEQLKAVKRLKLDQSSINKMQQLEDQNVGVQTLFESARQNPFQDEKQ